jgi:ubiquinone/menaquinone biosynthesis C-methylase UbiE
MDLTTHFIKETANIKNFQEAFSIAKENSGKGNIWIIGGLVYRNIINGLYGKRGEEIYDFDFIVENPASFEEIKLPQDWKIVRTGLGEPRFISGKKQIDLVALDNSVNPPEVKNLSRMSPREKMESYFRRVPLNIQALAYDVDNKRIIGDVGIQAIKDKRIQVNNIDECISFCKRRKISIREFINKKMNASGFNAVFPIFVDKEKTETEKFYNTYSIEYTKARGGNSFISDHLKKEFFKFMEKLPGKKVIDLGSGPGRDALLFRKEGLHPVCVDISIDMVKICKENGLEAIRMDIEDLDFENSSFDGVWAYTSLVHIPKKRIYNTLARIREILKPGGMFFVGMVGGDSEIQYQSKDKPKIKRFFALYQDEEFEKILSEYFTVICSKIFSTPKGEKYLNYLCQKI